MKVLVTGGAGFIGANLVRRLLKEGDSVICVDNLITGKKENIDELLSDKNFQFILHDINIYKDYGDVDKIYHLASIGSVYHYLNHPVETLKTGGMGTINILEFALKSGASVLFTSTSEVYGDPEVHPQREDYRGNVSPIGPRSCYDESKRYGEALMMAYHRKYGLDTKIARIFNTYGPFMDPDDRRVLPNFITQGLRGKPMTIFGDGKQTRSYCYVDDTVEGLLRLMDEDYHLPVNIGNPEEYTILETAEIVSEVIGVEKKFVFMPLPEDDPMRRKPDITRAKEILGWQPRVSFREGLKETIKWFQKRLA